MKTTYLPLADAVHAATGVKPHLATCLRWAVKGQRGIKLQTYFLGGRRFSTVQDVESYVEKVSIARNGVDQSVVVESASQVSKRAAKASRDLASRLA